MYCPGMNATDSQFQHSPLSYVPVYSALQHVTHVMSHAAFLLTRFQGKLKQAFFFHGSSLKIFFRFLAHSPSLSFVPPCSRPSDPTFNKPLKLGPHEHI